MSRVFICHSDKDRASAARIHDALESSGIDCWMAPLDVPPGMDYRRAIVEAIQRCALMVVIWSENINDSDHILTELDLALSRRLEVVPIRIRDVEPRPEILYSLGRRQRYDATSGPLEAHLPAIVDAIRGRLAASVAPGSPDARPAFPQEREAPASPVEFGIGEGSARPEAFLQGFARNRKRLSDPRTAVGTMSANGGRFRFEVQEFARVDGRPGTCLLAWHESLPHAFCVRDGMLHAFLAKGLVETLGVPTTDEGKVRSSWGSEAALQTFKVGDAPWQARRLYYLLGGPLAGKAFFTLGGILVRYEELGAETSPLGLPTASEESTEDGAVSRFEGGEIRWSRGNNRVEVRLASGR